VKPIEVQLGRKLTLDERTLPLDEWYSSPIFWAEGSMRTLTRMGAHRKLDRRRGLRARGFFGQIRTLQLRNSARFMQTARFAFSHLTRSLRHVCAGIAQSRETSKVGSIPVARLSIVSVVK
jgi:hypothetical protein